MAKQQLPSDNETLNGIHVELESRSSTMTQVFDGADKDKKLVVKFSAGVARVPFGRLAQIKKNRKFGYTFYLSKRGAKAVEAIEEQIAKIEAEEKKVKK